MKMTKTKLAKGFTLVELLVVIAIIAALAALSTPVVLKQQKKAAATEAVNNAKQHFILLFELTKTTVHTQATQPRCLLVRCRRFKRSIQRVFHSSQIDSEDIFYAKTGWTLKPDGDIGTAPTSLKHGADECGFVYVMKLQTQHSDH